MSTDRKKQTTPSEEIMDELRTKLGIKEFYNNANCIRKIIEARNDGIKRLREIQEFIDSTLAEMDMEHVENVTFVPECDNKVIVRLVRDIAGKLQIQTTINHKKLKPGILAIKYRINNKPEDN